MSAVPFPLPGMPGQSALMAEALALVRSGELQRASQRLMEGLQGGAHPPHAAESAVPTAFGAPRRERAARFSRSDIADVQDLQASADTHCPPRQSSSADGQGRFERVAFRHLGAEHPLHVYTPASAAAPAGRPLVLMLHGCTQEAQDFARGTRMNAEAERVGALVLYPTQLRAANPNGCWNWFRPEDQRAGAGEPALLLAMVRQVVASEAVDPRRVYVAGLSAGGAMAALLAREFPQVFAAAGVHSGLAAGAAHNTMGALSAMKSGAKGYQPAARNAEHAMPLIVFHGDLDATVHPRNGEQLLSAAAPHGKAETTAGKSADGQRYTRTVVRACDAGAVQAEHWLLHGAGHAWSGGDARGSHTSASGVNASQEMLRFFLEHPRANGAV